MNHQRPARSTAVLALITLLAWLIPAAAQNIGDIPPEVNIVTTGHRFPPNSYTLVVQEVGSPTPLLAHNIQQPLNPASTIKTLTTLAGLEVLGPDYRWETEIFALGPVTNGTLQGDLLIRGGGDPFLVEENVRSMLKMLQRRGISTITGDLIIDASLFDPSVAEESLLDNQAGRAYNVPPHPLLFNFQTINFYFYPDPNGSEVIIQADPPLPNLRIVNQLTQGVGACSGFQRGISFSENTDSNTVTFSGQFPNGCGEYSLTRAVLDAPQYAYGLFQVLWQQLGGELQGEMRLATLAELATADAPAFVVWQSPPLADVIKSINKYSNNMMTRQLLLALGLRGADTPATVDKGINAIRQYLDSVGIDHEALVMTNGSGLGREVRLTGELLAAVLQRAWQIPTMAEFVASLPLAGLDGTMESRLSTGDGRGSMHVKTGSLSGVAGIAGYVHAQSGKDYVVVAVVNHPQAHAGPGQELGDALLRWAWRQ